jgi:hypothetical protein
MSRSNLAFALTLAMAAAAAAGAAAAQVKSIAPGYWETTNQVLSPMRSTKVERRCIKPKDVAKFMEGPSNHIYHCTYPTRIIGDGTIELKGSCATRDGKPLPVSGQGTFTRDTFHMEARVAAQFGPMTIPVRASTDAKRLGADCPAENDAAAAEAPPAPEAAAQ